MLRSISLAVALVVLLSGSVLAAVCAEPQPGDPDDSKHFLFGRPEGRPEDRLLLTTEKTDDGEIPRVYELLYNFETNFADWVAYCLDVEIAADVSFDRDDFPFTSEPNIRANKRLETSDFTGSHDCIHIDRGHLAPWASFKGTGEVGLAQTMFISNVAPQNTFLNQGIWLDLEDGIRKLARSGRAVYVVTGTYYVDGDPESDLELTRANEPHRIPSGFWKIVTIIDDDGNIQTVGFVFDNHLPIAAEIEDEDYPWGPTLRHRIEAINDIEALTGLDFFPALDAFEQAELEFLKQSGDFLDFLDEEPTIPHPTFRPCVESVVWQQTNMEEIETASNMDAFRQALKNFTIM